MSMWYQWFIAAPMITIERPRVRSALPAKPRATDAIRSREMPVIASAQAGVQGSISS